MTTLRRMLLATAQEGPEAELTTPPKREKEDNQQLRQHLTMPPDLNTEPASASTTAVASGISSSQEESSVLERKRPRVSPTASTTQQFPTTLAGGACDGSPSDPIPGPESSSGDLPPPSPPPPPPPSPPADLIASETSGAEPKRTSLQDGSSPQNKSEVNIRPTIETAHGVAKHEQEELNGKKSPACVDNSKVKVRASASHRRIKEEASKELEDSSSEKDLKGDQAIPSQDIASKSINFHQNGGKKSEQEKSGLPQSYEKKKENGELTIKSHKRVEESSEPAITKDQAKGKHESDTKSNDEVTHPALGREVGSLKSNSRSVSRGSRGSKSQQQSKLKSAESEETAEPRNQTSPGGGPPRLSKRGRKEHEHIEEEAVTWVQCEKCQKWRDLPTSLNDSLPAHWWCSMNSWEPEYASCDAPQKEEETSVARGNLLQKTPIRAGVDDGIRPVAPVANNTSTSGKKRKKQRVGASAGASSNAAHSTSAADHEPSTGSGKTREKGGSRRSGKKGSAGGSGSGPKINKKRSDGPKTNLRPSISNMMNGNGINGMGKDKAGGKWAWVMCETCQQWRKLPPHVDVDGLPDKWYCHMNQWDKLRASCSAPQEADDGVAEQEAAAAVGTIVKLPDGVNLYGGQFFPLKGGRKNLPMNYRELIVTHYRTNFAKYDSAMNSFLNERYQGSSHFVPRGPNKPKNQKKACTDRGQSAVSNSIRHTSRATLGISNVAIVPQTTFRKIFDLAPPTPPGSFGSAMLARALNKKQNNSGSSAIVAANVPTPSSGNASNGTTESPLEANTPDRSDSKRTVAMDLDEESNTTVSGRNDRVAALTFIQASQDEAQLPRALLKLSKPWKRAGGWMKGNPSGLYCTNRG